MSWNIRTISTQSTALKLNLEKKQKKYTENTKNVQATQIGPSI